MTYQHWTTHSKATSLDLKVQPYFSPPQRLQAIPYSSNKEHNSQVQVKMSVITQ